MWLASDPRRSRLAYVCALADNCSSRAHSSWARNWLAPQVWGWLSTDETVGRLCWCRWCCRWSGLLVVVMFRWDSGWLGQRPCHRALPQACDCKAEREIEKPIRDTDLWFVLHAIQVVVRCDSPLFAHQSRQCLHIQANYTISNTIHIHDQQSYIAFNQTSTPQNSHKMNRQNCRRANDAIKKQPTANTFGTLIALIECDWIKLSGHSHIALLDQTCKWRPSERKNVRLW